MLLRAFIARQLSRPSGLFGRVAMPLFFRRANATLYRYCFDELAVGRSDRILEIGFGGGESLERLCALAPEGKVVGIDISADMVARAQNRLAGYIRSGRLALELGAIESAGFADGQFDRVLTANTIYFWPEPETTMSHVRRVLSPGGRAVIAFRSRASMRAAAPPLPGVRYWDPEEVTALMLAAGFAQVRLIHHDAGRWLDNVLAVGDVART